MPHYLLVAHKPESTYYCYGDHTTYPADFYIANMLERPVLVQELAKRMAENLILQQDEADWQFWIYKDGICLMAASECGTEVWDGKTNYDNMMAAGFYQNVVIEGMHKCRDNDIQEAEDIWEESQKLAQVLELERQRRQEEKRLQDEKDAREREYKMLADEFGTTRKSPRYARYLELSKEFGDVTGTHGRCDTCGHPCDAEGCTNDKSHQIAND